MVKSRAFYVFACASRYVSAKVCKQAMTECQAEPVRSLGHYFPPSLNTGQPLKQSGQYFPGMLYQPAVGQMGTIVEVLTFLPRPEASPEQPGQEDEDS